MTFENDIVHVEVEPRVDYVNNHKCRTCGKTIVGGHLAAVVYGYGSEILVVCRWHPDCVKDNENTTTVTGWRKQIYNTPAYIAWRAAVYERDGYTCALCDEYNGRLQAHHIHPLHNADDIRLVLDVKNGITLCRKCHEMISGHEDKLINEFVTMVRDRARDMEYDSDSKNMEPFDG